MGSKAHSVEFKAASLSGLRATAVHIPEPKSKSSSSRSRNSNSIGNKQHLQLQQQYWSNNNLYNKFSFMFYSTLYR